MPAWIRFLGVGAVASVLFLTFSNQWAQAGVQVPMYLASGVLLVRARWQRRGQRTDPLSTLAVVAFGAYFLASVWGVILPLTASSASAVAVPSPLDVLFLASYALLALLLWRIGSRAVGVGRRDILDTFIVVCGVAPVFWLVLIQPIFASAAISAAIVTYASYPVMVFALLAMTIRLAFVARRRTVPHALLATWILLELVADIVFLYASVNGTYVYGARWQVLWIVSASCIGALALHPRTEVLFERTTSPPVSGTRRLYVLALCLAAPLVTIIAIEANQDPQVVFTAVVALILVALMSLRLSGLMIDNATQAKVEGRLRQLTDDLAHRAMHDPLTGLGNRLLFAERADQALAQRPTERDRAAAVLLLDLDDFKTVNDTFGHEAGDRVLVEVSRRLERITRQGESIFRLGGDEFAFLLSQATLSDALHLADRISLALDEPLDLGPRMIRPVASIGISIALTGQDRNTLLAQADMAMYDGKSKDMNEPSVFDPSLYRATLERHQLERDLTEAMGRDEFRLLYQPILHLPTNETVAVEALIRWEHPTRGTISPIEFIPLAEANGVIREIGDWVIEQALAQLRAWDEVIVDCDLAMSVNVSPRQLADPEFVERTARSLAVSGVDPGRVCLEITEAAFGTDVEVMVERLHELKALGVRLAIDDFGTDYSSLAQLRRLQVDVLKIDKSFVDDIATQPAAWALITAIKQLADSLDKVTVAEGIETGGQLAHLLSLNVEFGQGFLFARPGLPEAITARLTADRLAGAAKAVPGGVNV